MRRLTLAAVAFGIFAAATAAARGDDQPVSRAELDKRAYQAASETIKRGVPMFNGGNQEGCYRLYEGSLVALRAMVDHRPDLVGVIDAQTAKAASGNSAYDNAFALRAALDEVVKQCGGAAASAKKPLWERLGGQAAVEAVIHDFVGLAAGNPQVNFFRDGKVKLDAAGAKNLEKRLVELVSATTGGPLEYGGRNMKSVHAGMGITDAEFDALAADLVATLNKFNVPQPEIDELVGVVASTRQDIVEVGKKPLWDRLGGEAGVRAVTKEFIQTAAADPKANIDRQGEYPLTPQRVARVQQQVVEFVSSVTGGPLKYTGRDMKNSHQGMKITESEFNAAAGHLIAALKKFNVPQAEIDELVGLVSGTAKDIIEVPGK